MSNIVITPHNSISQTVGQKRELFSFAVAQLGTDGEGNKSHFTFTCLINICNDPQAWQLHTATLGHQIYRLTQHPRVPTRWPRYIKSLCSSVLQRRKWNNCIKRHKIAYCSGRDHRYEPYCTTKGLPWLPDYCVPCSWGGLRWSTSLQEGFESFPFPTWSAWQSEMQSTLWKFFSKPFMPGEHQQLFFRTPLSRDTLLQTLAVKISPL